VSQLILAYSLH